MTVSVKVMAAQSPWTHERGADSVVVEVPYGDAIPAATGYAVGTMILDRNTMRWGSVYSGGGVKRWITEPMPVTVGNLGTENATAGYWLPYHPLDYNNAWAFGVRSLYDQTQANPSANYFAVDVTFSGVSIAAYDTQSATDDVWHTLHTDASAVLSFAGLSGVADANGAQGFKATITETGAQTMRHQTVIWLGEIME